MKEKHWGSLTSYMTWPFVLSAVAFIGAVGVCVLNWQAGLIAFAAAFVILLISILCRVLYRKRIMRELISFASEYAQVQKQLLNDLSVPYALLDGSSHVLWSNKLFQDLLKDKAKVGKSLSNVFPEFSPASFSLSDEFSEYHIEYGSRKFHAELHRVLITNELSDLVPDVKDADASLFALYFFDETKLLACEDQMQREKPVVGLLYLDNYEDVLEGVEEVRRSLLLALIDRKISTSITEMGGIFMKLEKDRYLLVLTKENLSGMQAEKFSLLSDVKTVNVGNDMAMTISIGFGMNGESYQENYLFAHTAIDMALARGGDQVVLKDRETITYYGGKTQTMERNTRVKARVKAQALRELIETKERVIIMGHQIPDVDCIGASVGIYRAARYSGKKANIVLNECTASIRPLLDRFTDNKDYDDELFITSDRAKELINPSDTVLVIVDVNRPSYTECQELLSLTPHIVVLDHHRVTREVIENAVLSYVEPNASSTCEMVAEILQYYGDNVKLKMLDADALYAGIVIDTNNFRTSAGTRTFEAAAFLRRSGADVVRVRKLFRDDMDDTRIKAEIISHAELFDSCFAISYCEENSSDDPTVLAAQAANELLSVRGVTASFVLSKYHDTVYISARSIDEINVQVIMERLGGGGHMTIAGAQVKNTTIEEVIVLLKDILHQMKENQEF